MAVFSQEQLDIAREDFAAGNKAAWERLVGQLRSRIEEWAAKARPQDADDITAGIVNHLYCCSPDKFKTLENLEAYIRHSVNKRAIDFVKTKKAKTKNAMADGRAFAHTLDPREFEPYQILIAQESEEIIRSGLSEVDRDIYDGMLSGEAEEKGAEKLGMSVRTLRRHREKIRSYAEQVINGDGVRRR